MPALKMTSDLHRRGADVNAIIGLLRQARELLDISEEEIADGQAWRSADARAVRAQVHCGLDSAAGRDAEPCIDDYLVRPGIALAA